MRAKFQIIFFCVGMLVAGSWGADDSQRSDGEGAQPVWYQLQQEDIRRDRIGSRIFLWFTAFTIVGTLTLNYFLPPNSK